MGTLQCSAAKEEPRLAQLVCPVNRLSLNPVCQIEQHVACACSRWHCLQKHKRAQPAREVQCCQTLACKDALLVKRQYGSFPWPTIHCSTMFTGPLQRQSEIRNSCPERGPRALQAAARGSGPQLSPPALHGRRPPKNRPPRICRLLWSLFALFLR